MTTSKTNQFCETSSIFERNNVKTETGLRDFCIFQTWQHQKRSNSEGLTFSTSQLPKVVRTWVFLAFSLANVLRASTACTFSTSQLPTVVLFCAFWLRNVLCATTACNFSSLIWPDGSAPAALASLLFDPPEPQIIGKTQCFATVLPFRAPGSSFFWDFLCFDLLSSSLLFSDSSHLCFLFVHIVGSLTSKLPSIIGSNVVNPDPSLRTCHGTWQIPTM